MNQQTGDHSRLFTHCLSNGLQVVGELMPDAPSVSVGIFVQTGARDEPDASVSGISHFLEHMVFRGTQRLNWQQLKQEFTRIGAEKNGYTYLEWTYYYLRIQPEYLAQAIRLLSEMMNPRLDSEDFEQEKGVILNEIARAEDQPSVYARRLMLHTYFGEHPLGNLVLGTPESIRAMSVEQMRDYWHRRYGASNLMCSVVGNFDWQQCISLVEAHCGTWAAGNAERVITPYEPPQSASFVFVRPHLKQQTVLLSLPMIASDDPDYHAAQLAASILGHPDGSRLYWHLRQRGLAQSATCGLWTMQGAGVLVLSALTTPENAPQVVQVLRSEVKQLLTDGITEEELHRAKNKRIKLFVFSSESTRNRMYWLATDWMDLGRLSTVEEEIARVEQVTREDVMRVLQRFPLLDKQVLTAFGPLDEQAFVMKKNGLI